MVGSPCKYMHKCGAKATEYSLHKPMGLFTHFYNNRRARYKHLFQQFLPTLCPRQIGFSPSGTKVNGVTGPICHQIEWSFYLDASLSMAIEFGEKVFDSGHWKQLGFVDLNDEKEKNERKKRKKLEWFVRFELSNRGLRRAHIWKRWNFEFKIDFNNIGENRHDSIPPQCTKFNKKGGKDT